MHIIIPAAGLGSRFKNSEFTSPKPLIAWNNKPMLEHVIDNFLASDIRITIIKQSKFDFMYSHPNINILNIDYITDGPATTASLVSNLVDQDEELMITNCDQIIKDWNKNTFIDFSKN